MAKLYKSIWSLVTIAVIVIAVAVITLVITHRSSEPVLIEAESTVVVQQEVPVKPAVESAKTEHESKPEPAPAVANPNISLNDVVRTARGWDVIHSSWFGKTAPDFSLKDIDGKVHRLNNYRSKNVLVVFWATWCPPCRMTIPHLIELQNSFGKDKVAIFAISHKSISETTETVRNFVKQNKEINYTVFSCDVGALPIPFSQIGGIPCIFFITPEGKIKLATVGLLPLKAMKDIIRAQSP